MRPKSGKSGANDGPGILPVRLAEGLTHRFTEDDMRNLDFAPLYRATVGFDRIADLMDRVLTADVPQPTYPSYNIEKTDDNAYRISIAVAGFSPDELGVEVKDVTLVVTARKSEEDAARSFLHRGIATRAFERRFALADHVRVTGAGHENGMLHIDLIREMPEALKPRRIAIAHASPTATIEGQSQGGIQTQA
jgi:molecular chaperone IbpA